MSWTTDVILPFGTIAVLLFLAVSWYLRQGRNPILEDMVQRGEFGSTRGFSGTLSVEREDPGHFLRLSKNTQSNRWLQLRYRWLGMGRQAIFDEVTFDGPRGVVLLKNAKKQNERRFPEFLAIGIREVSGGKGGGSFWHVELVPQSGRPIPFVTSLVADRKWGFERASAIAKAVSAITMLPVQVSVAGNIWTPGWPPKKTPASL